MKYASQLNRAMMMLALHPKTVFLGQSVEYPGTAMTNTLAGVPKDRLLELPVAEEMQMGMSIGMALNGFIPVSIYPRWNFLLLAVNQLVNHLDKLPAMGYRPKVIVRTGIGSIRPLHPQHQHVGDFTDAFRSMLTTVKVVRLEEPEEIFPAYQAALASEGSTLLIEYGDYHQEK